MGVPLSFPSRFLRDSALIGRPSTSAIVVLCSSPRFSGVEPASKIISHPLDSDHSYVYCTRYIVQRTVINELVFATFVPIRGVPAGPWEGAGLVAGTSSGREKLGTRGPGVRRIDHSFRHLTKFQESSSAREILIVGLRRGDWQASWN